MVAVVAMPTAGAIRGIALEHKGEHAVQHRPERDFLAPAWEERLIIIPIGYFYCDT